MKVTVVRKMSRSKAGEWSAIFLAKSMMSRSWVFSWSMSAGQVCMSCSSAAARHCLLSCTCGSGVRSSTTSRWGSRGEAGGRCAHPYRGSSCSKAPEAKVPTQGWGQHTGAGRGLCGSPDPRGPSAPTVRRGTSGLGPMMAPSGRPSWGQEADRPGPAQGHFRPHFGKSHTHDTEGVVRQFLSLI